VAALHVTTVTSRLEPPRRESVLATLRHEVEALETEYGSVLDGLNRPGDHATSRAAGLML
jgi:hypothetical protein